MRKQAIVFMVLAAACLGQFGQSDETCCPTRELAMMPTPMPAGQEQDLSNFYEGAVLHPLIWDAIDSIDAGCPEISFYDLPAKAEAEDLVVKIDAAVRKQKGLPADKNAWKPPPPEKDMDYVLKAKLLADQVTGKDLSGNLEGTFTFHLALVDHHHKDAVVKEGSVSWTGGIMHGGDAVESMAEKFRPLPPLLKGYERFPEKARIEVPDDQAEAGDTTAITLSKLLDKDGRQTQWWQRLFVHIEKGKILNAEEVKEHQGKNYYIFRADKGTVEIQYQAPDDCNKIREKLTVYNCCEKKEPPCFMSLRPRKEIASKEFDIVCRHWQLTITSSSEKRYRYDYTHAGQTIRHADDEVISAKVTLPLVLDHLLDVPNEGQRWEYYHAESRDLSYFSATSNSERFNRSDYGDYGAETTHTVHKTPSDAKFDSPFLNDVVILAFDRKTGKAVKATIPLYGISYTWHVEDKLHTVQWSPKTGKREENKENPEKENDDYYMRPVEDEITDPTVKAGGIKDYVDELFRQRGLTPPANIPIKEKTKVSKIHPDFLVKGGDGASSFSGEGKKTTFKPGSPGSTRREEKIFKWEIKRSKK